MQLFDKWYFELEMWCAIVSDINCKRKVHLFWLYCMTWFFTRHCLNVIDCCNLWRKNFEVWCTFIGINVKCDCQFFCTTQYSCCNLLDSNFWTGSSGRHIGGALDFLQPDWETEGNQRAEETQSMPRVVPFSQINIHCIVIQRLEHSYFAVMKIRWFESQNATYFPVFANQFDNIAHSYANH